MRVTATLSGWELLLRRNTHHDRFTIMSNLKFLHFPVAAKAVLLIAALGLLSIAANWFCLERLDEFDRLNATLTRHLAPARLALAEAKAASESFGSTKIIRPPIPIKPRNRSRRWRDNTTPPSVR